MDDISGIQSAKVTLVDKVRDGILGIVQEMPATWGSLDEVKQAQYIELAARVAIQAVNGCCDIIASDGREVVDVQVGNVTANKTTVNATVSVPRDKAEAHTLFNVAHGSAKMAFVEVGRYTSENTRPDPTPDQPDMLDTQSVSRTAEAIKEGVKKAALDTKRKTKGKEGLPDAKLIKKHLEAEAGPEIDDDVLAAVQDEFEAQKREAVPQSTPVPETGKSPAKAKAKRSPRAPRRKVDRSSVEVDAPKNGRGRKRTVAVETRTAAPVDDLA